MTSSILEKMLAYAEVWMANEQWSPDEIMVFKSDPVVRLLYGACAEEIGNVHEEIFHVKQRFIKETIEKLLPEEFHTPTPAHAIVTQGPSTNQGNVKSGLTHKSSSKSRKISVKISYSPRPAILPYRRPR